MSKRVMVASRAVRRGRRLKARSTMPPPPQTATPEGSVEAIEDEPSHQTAVDAPSAPESGEGLLGERRPSDAPTAEALDESPEAPDELEGAAPPSARDGEPAAQHADEDDEDDEVDEDDEALDRISGYSRPPAPAFDFGASADDEDEDDDELDDEDADDDVEDGVASPTDVAMDFDDDEEEPAALTPITRRVGSDEEEGDEDPNATTLISVPSPRPGSTPPPPSRITIEEAAPSSERLEASDDEAEDDDAGFVPEREEPPLSERPAAALEEPSPSSPIADVKVGYRDEDASLAPVVDDLALEDEAELALFDAAAEKRRHAFRRGVGVVLAAVVLGTVALITVSAFRGGDEDAQAAAAPPAVPAEATPPPAVDRAPGDGEAALAAEAPAAEPPDAAEAAAEGDYEALSTQTLELLNDREFERARELAEKLVALQPDNAFGYRCLGSALQDMGKIQEARDVYSQCVTKATKGEVTECRALGGAKR